LTSFIAPRLTELMTAVNTGQLALPSWSNQLFGGMDERLLRKAALLYQFSRPLIGVMPADLKFLE
jgi:hypothetical protein